MNWVKRSGSAPPSQTVSRRDEEAGDRSEIQPRIEEAGDRSEIQSKIEEISEVDRDGEPSNAIKVRKDLPNLDHAQRLGSDSFHPPFL